METKLAGTKIKSQPIAIKGLVRMRAFPNILSIVLKRSYLNWHKLSQNYVLNVNSGSIYSTTTNSNRG
jgi:hypothetical protein